MKFKKIKVFMMVLVSAAVLLPPIYFVILQTPIELVPHSQKVINYFYDGRIFIGISKVVPNDGKAFEGVHDENWRAIRRLRERDVWHEGTDDPEIRIDDSELPSEIDQSVEEALHSPSALSLPPDLVEPVTQSEADPNREGPKGDPLSESLDKAAHPEPVDKDAEPQKATVNAPHVSASSHPTSPRSTSPRSTSPRFTSPHSTSPTAQLHEAHPHSTQRNHTQAITPNATPPLSHSKLPTNTTPPLSHPKPLTSTTTPLSHPKLSTSTTTPLSHSKPPTSTTTPLSHPNTTPPLSYRKASTSTTPPQSTSSNPLTKTQTKIEGEPPSSYTTSRSTSQPSEKEKPVEEATDPLPAPLALPPPPKVAMSESLRKAMEAVAKSRVKLSQALVRTKQAVTSRVTVLSKKAKGTLISRASMLAKKGRARRKPHVYRRPPVIANCTDSMCKQLTVNREKNYYDLCLKQAEKDYSVQPCQCRLMDGKKRGRYALVSLPGSGNTWVRGLLEKATGVCTGSMWCDPSLRAKHFCMEGVRSTSMLVVKNHDTRLRWVGVSLLPGETAHNKPDFVGAILIHRDPFSATIAEWNRDAGIILRNATQNKTETSTTSESTSKNRKKKAVVVKTSKASPSSPEDNQSENITKFRDTISAEARKSVQKWLEHKVAPGSIKTSNQHLLYFGKEMFGKSMLLHCLH